MHVELPLDEPVSDMKEAVQKLRTCTTEELRRARKRHRRALQALRDGAYEALSERTRERLLKRFHENLEALNRALDGGIDSRISGAASDPSTEGSSRATYSVFQLRKMVTWFW